MRTLFIAFIVLIAGSVSAQNCKAFLPYSKGTVWEITDYTAKGKETGRTAYELVDKKESGKNFTFTVKAVAYDDKGKEVFSNSYDAFCKGGKFGFDMNYMMDGQSMQAYNEMDMEVDATELEIPDMNTPAGTKLNDASLQIQIAGLFKMTINVTERVVEAKEKQETPAGTFDCIKISQRVSTKMMVKVNMLAKEWYAEGVGLVASETYNKKGKLVGYSKLT
ncbi:MAG: hypothetical protein ABFS16_10805, partial [Bacteroidota bacterium]